MRHPTPAELLELQPGMSLCELGCGPGWMTRMAARHGLEAFGYDISPGMIEIALSGTPAALNAAACSRGTSSGARSRRLSSRRQM